MLATCLNGNYVTSIYWMLHAVNTNHALTGNNVPNLVTSAVAMVVHTLPSVHHNFYCDAAFFRINNSEITPRLFSEHNLMIDPIYIRFNLTGLFFVRNQNTFRFTDTTTSLSPIQTTGIFNSLITWTLLHLSSKIALPMVDSDITSVSVFHVPKSLH